MDSFIGWTGDDEDDHPLRLLIRHAFTRILTSWGPCCSEFPAGGWSAALRREWAVSARRQLTNRQCRTVRMGR
jgi:hypothetical protein